MAGWHPLDLRTSLDNYVCSTIIRPNFPPSDSARHTPTQFHSTQFHLTSMCRRSWNTVMMVPRHYSDSHYSDIIDAAGTWNWVKLCRGLSGWVRWEKSWIGFGGGSRILARGMRTGGNPIPSAPLPSPLKRHSDEGCHDKIRTILITIICCMQG